MSRFPALRTSNASVRHLLPVCETRPPSCWTLERYAWVPAPWFFVLLCFVWQGCVSGIVKCEAVDMVRLFEASEATLKEHPAEQASPLPATQPHSFVNTCHVSINVMPKALARLQHFAAYRFCAPSCSHPYKKLGGIITQVLFSCFFFFQKWGDVQPGEMNGKQQYWIRRFSGIRLLRGVAECGGHRCTGFSYPHNNGTTAH